MTLAPASPRREAQAEEREHAEDEGADRGREEGVVVIGDLRLLFEHDDFFHLVDALEDGWRALRAWRR